MYNIIIHPDTKIKYNINSLYGKYLILRFYLNSIGGNKQDISKIKFLRKIDKKLLEKYELIKILGKEGKDGLTCLGREKGTGKKYAIKIFKKKKSIKNINKEVRYQERASRVGIAPKIKEVIGRNIIMELMGDTLENIIKKNKKLNNKQAKEIVKLYKILSDLKILHNDENVLKNIMIDKNNKLKLIDFGMAIDLKSSDIKKYGNNPNLKILNKITRYNKWINKYINKYEKKYGVIIDYRKKIKEKINQRLKKRIKLMKQKLNNDR